MPVSRLSNLVSRLTVVLMLCAICSTTAKNSLIQDPSEYQQHYGYAVRFEENGELEKAIASYKNALSSTSNFSEIVECNKKLAELYLNIGVRDSGNYYINKNLALDSSQFNTTHLRKLLVDTYDLKAKYHRRSGDPHKAIEALLNAGKLAEGAELEPIVEIDIYRQIGTSYDELAQYSLALDWLNTALEMAQENRESIPAHIIPEIYDDLGTLYFYLHDYEKAISYHKFSLELIEGNRRQFARQYVNFAINLGLVYGNMGKFDTAIVYLDKALAFFPVYERTETDKDKAAYFKTGILVNKGATHIFLGQYDLAEKSMFEALKLSRQSFGEGHWLTGAIYSEIGRNNFEQGKYESALEYSEVSLAIKKGAFGIKNSRVVYAYTDLGDIYLGMEDYHKANKYYDSALYSNVKINLNNKEVYAEIGGAVTTLLGKVRALEKLDFEANYEQQLDEVYRQSTDLLSFTYQKTDPSFLEDSPALLGSLYSQYLALYQKEDRPEYLEKLWALAEFNKSRKLITQVNHLTALDSAISDELRQQEQNLRDSIVQVMNIMSEDQEFGDSLLFTINTRYDNLLSEFEEKYPAYYELKYSNRPSSIEAVQLSLNDETGLLNYFEDYNNVYSIYVSSQQIQLNVIPKNELDSMMLLFNQSLGSNPVTGFDTVGFDLRSRLISDDIDLTGIKFLEIIPDGSIWSINFSVLPEGPGGSFLGEKINMVYQYSYGHHKLIESVGSTDPNRILAFSFDATSPGSEGKSLSYITFRDLDSDLPGTSFEIREISEIWKGNYYYGDAATEGAFKNQSANFNILHLALHGITNDEDPDYSQLKFVSRDSTEDGILHAYEIYNLDLNSELVVLSACHSGTGKIINGEGIMSLGRAFSYAGAKSLLLSKWEVSDATTPYIMRYFYQGLKEGLRKSEALRFAKSEFLKNDADNITRSPYYWASFYILGDDSPIPTDGDSKYLWFILAAVVIVSAIVFNRKSWF